MNQKVENIDELILEFKNLKITEEDINNFQITDTVTITQKDFPNEILTNIHNNMKTADTNEMNDYLALFASKNSINPNNMSFKKISIKNIILQRKKKELIDILKNYQSENKLTTNI